MVLSLATRGRHGNTMFNIVYFLEARKHSVLNLELSHMFFDPLGHENLVLQGPDPHIPTSGAPPVYVTTPSFPTSTSNNYY